MKNFDVARAARRDGERDFQLGGEQFRVKSGVRPEVMAEYDAIDSSATDSTEMLRIIDEFVVNMIEPDNDAEARYRALREREDDPVTISDLIAVGEWMVETQTGRPTGQPTG